MLDELGRRPGYAKLQVLTQAVGLGTQETAQILDLPVDLVGRVFNTGIIPKSATANEHERFEYMLLLMSYLAEIARYDKTELQVLWSQNGTKYYKDAIDHPPWYDSGLDDYLRRERLSGLTHSITWLGKHQVY